MSIFWQTTVLLLLGSCHSGFSMDDGIVGGKVSKPHSHPYMVYIQDFITKNTCDGFLVREDFVMTAAHCKLSDLRVYLGVNDTNFLPAGVEVKAFPHRRFQENKPGHDIMLLKLKTPANLNENVKTIPWQRSKNKEITKNCMVMGWGWTEYETWSPSSVLKEANVTLMDSENCDPKDTVCTKGSPGPARGDSGGPIVCGGLAVGIVSYYSKTDYLTRYTDIHYYHTWIEDIINSNSAHLKTWKGKLDKL